MRAQYSSGSEVCLHILDSGKQDSMFQTAFYIYNNTYWTYALGAVLGALMKALKLWWAEESSGELCTRWDWGGARELHFDSFFRWFWSRGHTLRHAAIKTGRKRAKVSGTQTLKQFGPLSSWPSPDCQMPALTVLIWPAQLLNVWFALIWADGLSSRMVLGQPQVPLPWAVPTVTSSPSLPAEEGEPSLLSAEVQEGPPGCCPPGGMQTGLAHLGYSNPSHGCQPRCLHWDSSPRRASLLSQGPLGHQCQGSQEALCVGSYLVLLSSLWAEPHLCIDTKTEAFWGHCGCFSPRHNSPWAHTHMSLVEFLTLLLGGSD